MSDIIIDITQRSDGTIDGSWSATSNPAIVDCPPGLGPQPAGTVTGTSTVLEVTLAVAGVGDFHGQAIEGKTLEGNFVSCSIYPATFSFVGPIPGG